MYKLSKILFATSVPSSPNERLLTTRLHSEQSRKTRMRQTGQTPPEAGRTECGGFLC
ncbi:MAG: hypothetical protein QME52_09535 [Bacteroidota bacterium]|nr:hypothetical protein [Bacteroidota bacterium]